MNGREGFTLLELMVTLLLLAILVTLALPAYRQSVIRANRAVGKLALIEVVARQERFLQIHKRYGASLDELGLGEPYLVDASASPVEEERAIYRIALAQGEDGAYRGVTAMPRNGQLKDLDCGVLTQLLTGEREVSGRHRDDPGLCWRG